MALYSESQKMAIMQKMMPSEIQKGSIIAQESRISKATFYPNYEENY